MRDSYSEFTARELFCPRCRAAMPVKERLLLYVPGGKIYDYVCARCGQSLGKKEAPESKVQPGDRYPLKDKKF